MKRENFILLITSLQNQRERENQLMDTLTNFFDGYLISKLSNDFQDSVIKVLESEMNDPYISSKYGSIISWWLFDAPNGGKNHDSAYIIYKNDKIELKDAGQLYDYLIKFNVQ